jgi:hypothetical protein
MTGACDLPESVTKIQPRCPIGTCRASFIATLESSQAKQTFVEPELEAVG